MRLTRRFLGSPLEILLLASVSAGCSGTSPGDSAAGGSATTPPPAGGSPSVPMPDLPAAGGSGATGGGTTAGAAPQAGSTAMAAAGTGGMMSEAGSGGMASGGSTGMIPTDERCEGRDQPPMGTDDSSPQPSYEGELPLYCGPEVGPIVEMDCEGDPTEGWTEYAETFKVQRPYDEPINTRFSIIDGVYTHWVFPNDSPHSRTANGRNPRSEARYGYLRDDDTGAEFQTGNRMFSADMFIERSAVNSAIMQIHTNASGGGPIGVRIHSNSDMVNNGSRTVVEGDSVEGGLIDTWFNFKASLNADTLEVKIYINNCLKSTYQGDRGDGNFYFKNGVYFCKTSQNGCFAHFKNIRLYEK